MSGYARFLAAFLVVAGSAGLPTASSAQPGSPSVLVLLQNNAGVPPEVTAKAQAEVTRLYALIGVEVVWVTEIPQTGRRARVVSLVRWEPSDAKTPESALGVTYGDRQQRGYLAYVFAPRVARASQHFTALLSHVLAIAMAHELGHMLLPHGSRAKRGLMEEGWDSGHFRSASAGLLHFAGESGDLIRRGLIAEAAVIRAGR